MFVCVWHFWAFFLQWKSSHNIISSCIISVKAIFRRVFDSWPCVHSFKNKTVDIHDSFLIDFNWVNIHLREKKYQASIFLK